MKITKELLKQIIKEEVQNLKENIDAQQKKTSDAVGQALIELALLIKQMGGDPKDNPMIKSLSSLNNILKQPGAVRAMQQNMKSPVRSLSDIESDTIAVVKQQLKNLQQQKNLVDPATQRTIADLKQKIEKLQQKK